MSKTVATALAVLIASVTVAAVAAEPETAGSDKARAAAEAKHLTKQHGIDKSAKQAEAQAPADPKSQAAAEAKHLKKKHGNVNDSADKRTAKDAPKY